MHNRRRYVRIKAALRFTFAWADGFEVYRTMDVSAGGARVYQSDKNGRRPAPGTQGECAFALDGVELRTVAVVVRHHRDGFAVRFLQLSQAQERSVVAWVFRQEALALSRRIPA
ncbi:MAG: PilZ domain-containing protein [Myxococcaceae bacterium]|nr:PilZ domain-containing protein [Myxococcaceae bacterium]MCA3012767.1 PilZ domain-containing protein [Myxococcaceae bacterium]